jgi:hypothetical protein
MIDWVRDLQDATTTEHFRCKCGHEWSREMEDGLIAVGCPICQREHLTMLGRFMLPIINSARQRGESER